MRAVDLLVVFTRVWLMLTVVACQPERAFLLISLDGLSAQPQTVEIRAVLEASRQDAIERWTGLVGPSGSVSMWLPPGASGPLSIMATELASGCAVAQGTAASVVDGQPRIQLAVALSPLNPPHCEVTVDRSGDGFGIVTVEPPSTGAPLACGERCTFRAPRGTTVTLKAQAQAPGFLSQWTGCLPSSPAQMHCQLSVIGGGLHVGAEFKARSCTPGTLCDEYPAPPRPPAFAKPMTAVWGPSSQEVWAADAGGSIFHKREGFWSEENPPTVPRNLGAIYGLNEQEIWAVGNERDRSDGLALHFLNGRWETMPLPINALVVAAFGDAPDYFFAVGYDGKMLRWNGKTWGQGTPQPATNILSGIWGVGGKLWVTGAGLYRYNGGNTWQREPLVDTNFRGAIWGTSETDFWVLGAPDQCLRLQGGKFVLSPLPAEPGGRYSAISGTGNRDVWAAHESGSLYHFDGTQWTMKAKRPDALWAGLWAAAPGEVYVVGAKSTLAHMRP